MTDLTSDYSSTQSIPVVKTRGTRTGQSHSPTRAQAGIADPGTLHELMRPEANVQRIMWTGTIWFAAAVGSVAVVLGLLLSSGWRPALLSIGVRTVWWIGAAIVAVSIGLIGWSGCPILETSVPVADSNKSRTMQFGTAMFIGGTAIAMLAVMLGPAL